MSGLDQRSTSGYAAGMNVDLSDLAQRMRADSERWFPSIHNAPLIPLPVFYALGLAGETGEAVDEIKKAFRTDGDLSLRANLGAELADVFTYLLLLADEIGVDIIAEYETKAVFNEERWGKP